MGASRGHNVQTIALTALWTVSVLLMIFGTHYGSVVRLAWGVWFALAAGVLSVRWIVEAAGERHALRIERLARIMAEEAARENPADEQSASVRHLH